MIEGFYGVCLHKSGDITTQHFSDFKDVSTWARSRGFEGTVLLNRNGIPITIYTSDVESGRELRL